MKIASTLIVDKFYIIYFNGTSNKAIYIIKYLRDNGDKMYPIECFVYEALNMYVFNKSISIKVRHPFRQDGLNKSDIIFELTEEEVMKHILMETI